MLKDRFRSSLRIQFLTVISGILVVALSLMGAMIIYNENSLLQKSLQNKGQSLGGYIAKLSGDPLLLKDNLKLDDIVNEVNKDDEVAYAVIKDKTDRIVTTSFASFNYQLKELKAVTAKLPADMEISQTLAAVRHADIAIELTIPVMLETETLGKVMIGMSKHKINKDLIRTTIFIFSLIISIIAFLGWALFGATKRILLNPIADLIQVSRQVAAGNLAQTVVIRSNDELGELAKATNKMIDNLKNLIAGIRENAVRTAASAERIAASSLQVKGGAKTTAKATEETLVSMEQMRSSIQSVAGNADALSANVQQTAASITEMMKSVENAAKNMETLSSAVSDTSSTVEEMTMNTEEIARNMDVLTSNVVETSSTIEEMTSSIDSVATNTEELSNVVTNTAHSIEELTKSVENVGKHIREAGTLSQSSVEEAKTGGAALSEAFKGMRDISETMNGIATLVKNLGTSSEEIGNIVEVIDKIADQTNLLALNAAIEAARA